MTDHARARRRRNKGALWTGFKRQMLSCSSYVAMMSWMCQFHAGLAFQGTASPNSHVQRSKSPIAANTVAAITTVRCISNFYRMQRLGGTCLLLAGGGGAPRFGDRSLLWSREGDDDASKGGQDEVLFPDTIGQTAPKGVSPDAWERVTRSARDKWLENERLSPSPKHTPRHVAAVTLQALRDNDQPRPNHGCEVAIRFSSSLNPASSFTPGGMRAYLDDPTLPFYRILGDWDEMDSGGDLEVDEDGARAYQQIRVRREVDPGWSTVNVNLVREDGCWLIERLWVDDKSVEGQRAVSADGGRGQAGDRRLTLAELFDEDRLEVMSFKYKAYDPERLTAGDGEWLEEFPSPSLSPKAVALTCILSLRQNDDGTSGSLDGDTEVGESKVNGTTGASSPSTTSGRKRNEGCERVIRFCSPTNVASTLTPSHFAQYLDDPWYAIFNEWDELAFHSEDFSDDGTMADLVVLLRPEGEEWTSVNWELVKVNDMWLTEKIWVDDV